MGDEMSLSRSRLGDIITIFGSLPGRADVGHWERAVTIICPKSWLAVKDPDSKHPLLGAKLPPYPRETCTATSLMWKLNGLPGSRDTGNRNRSSII